MRHENYQRLYEELGIPTDYGMERDLPSYDEAAEWVDAGPNLVGRMQRLTPLAAARWQQMVETSGAEGIRLLIVSGFRSVDYQADLIRNKLKSGQQIDEILTVNAAPGYSQHHAGTAIDIATPGCRPLSDEFEDSDAFAWLTRQAADFGFSMTYPRDNPGGFIYEPWHWALHKISA